jgi:hypothetical protein
MSLRRDNAAWTYMSSVFSFSNESSFDLMRMHSAASACLDRLSGNRYRRRNPVKKMSESPNSASKFRRRFFLVESVTSSMPEEIISDVFKQ